MRTSVIIAVSLLVLVGCGGNGGPVSLMSPQVGNGLLHLPTQPERDAGEELTPQSLTDGDPTASAAQQLSAGGRLPVAEARSLIGAPIIYSTTGGPLPDTERAGQVQVGANVTPLPDWKRPERWSDPVNGVSVSTGRTQDGARAARVAEYVIAHIDDKWEPQGYANEPTTDIPGLASFQYPPVLRLAEGTSDQHAAYALHAIALINALLPSDKRILVGPAAPRLADIETVPDGQVFIDFAAKSDWHPVSEATALHEPSYQHEFDEASQRWEIKGMRAGHVWIDPSAFASQAELVRVLVHEMLHALGLRGHAFLDSFPESILRNGYLTLLPTDVQIPDIDGDGLLAIYTRLAPGTEPEHLLSATLGLSTSLLEPWDNESLRMHGKLEVPGGAAFGAAFRNDLARPWAFGPEPLSSLGENYSIAGSATWNGALLGFTLGGRSVAGLAEIGVDLAALTGRADFTDLEEWSSAKWEGPGKWSVWGDGDLGYTIAVHGNKIRETGGDEGVLTGSFVGRQHKGAVGTLEREDLSAAFGGSRTADDCTAAPETQDACEQEEKARRELAAGRHAVLKALAAAAKARTACETVAAACESAARATYAANQARDDLNLAQTAPSPSQAAALLSRAFAAAAEAEVEAAKAISLAGGSPTPGPVDRPVANWSDSEWVSFESTSKVWDYRGSSVPESQSEWVRRMKFSSPVAQIGELGIWKITESESEYEKMNMVETPSGQIELIRIRGKHFENKYGERRDLLVEEGGGLLGYTNWGWWAVGWSQTPDETEQRFCRFCLIKGGETLLQVFDKERENHSIEFADSLDYGPWDKNETVTTNRHFSDLPEQTSLGPVESVRKEWSASYKGLMTGIAHNFNGRPVTGAVNIEAKFHNTYYSLNKLTDWVDSLDISISDIQGSDFAIADINFPTIDGNAPRAGTGHYGHPTDFFGDPIPEEGTGFAHHRQFELDHPRYFRFRKISRWHESSSPRNIFKWQGNWWVWCASHRFA